MGRTGTAGTGMRLFHLRHRSQIAPSGRSERSPVRTRTLAAILCVLSQMLFPARSQAQEPHKLRLIPLTPHSSIKVDASFPRVPGVCEARQPGKLHAAYKGIIEVGRRPDGRLYLITELPFSDYLKGIAEVPRNWPVESLKAQAVAARTYAVKHFNPSTALAKELGINLCSTDACQVFRGLQVERGAWGERWVQAVDETTGEILEYRGKPADTLYFSTSNGRTLSNEEVFGSDPLEYLASVKETDDGESPLSNWTVKIPLADLSEILRMTGAIDVAVETVKQEGESIKFSGGGREGSLSLADFRKQLNARAACLVPKRYPTRGSDGRPLPQVIPSKWMTVRQEGPEIVVEGRGWGHGAGMVQWGAKGKAERGMGYRDILAFYYGGLTPVTRPEPDIIRVSLAFGIEQLTIERRGDFRVEGGRLPDGPVKLQTGPSIRVSPGEPIAPVLALRNAVLSQPGAGKITVSFELSHPANVTAVFRTPDGKETSLPTEPKDRGPQTLDLDAEKAALPAGLQELILTADDGVDRATSPPLPLTITAPPAVVAPSPKSAPKTSARDSSPDPAWPALTAAALLVSAALAALVLLRKRKRS